MSGGATEEKKVQRAVAEQWDKVQEKGVSFTHAVERQWDKGVAKGKELNVELKEAAKQQARKLKQ